MNFPLFDIILGEIDTNKSTIDIKRLCDNIKRLDEEGYEFMYALIKCYALRFNEDCASPPFQGKKCKGGYKFDVAQIPDHLLHILNHFVDKHINKMKEEHIRNVPTPSEGICI